MTLSKFSLMQLGGIAAFLILVVLLVGAFSGKVNVAVIPGDVAGADGGKVDGQFSTNPSPSPASEPKLGSASSPSVINGCMEINDTTVCYYGSAWAVASTSCQFKLPSATSSVTFAAAYPKTMGGTANFGEWGYSKDVMSTTTSLGSGTISATVQTVISASSSPGWTVNNVTAMLPPGGYLVFKQGSTTPTGVTGRCSASVQTI